MQIKYEGMDIVGFYIEQAEEYVNNQHDMLIQSLLDEHGVSVDEIKERCQILVYPDGKEAIAIDGKQIALFGPLQSRCFYPDGDVTKNTITFQVWRDRLA